jgi:hypothetical protein
MSRSTFALAAAALAALSSGSTALATLSFPPASGNAFTSDSTAMVQVPIDAGALADDPSLASYDAYDLVVSISPGDHWSVAELRMQLLTGTFYIPPVGDDDKGLQPFSNFTGFRFLRDDTFVSAPGLNPDRVSSIFGSSNVIFPGSRPTATFPRATNDKTLVDAGWGDIGALTDNLSGLQTVARFVFTKDSAPVVRGRMSSTADPSKSYFFSADPTPEPGSSAALVAGVGAIALRRRKK